MEFDNLPHQRCVQPSEESQAEVVSAHTSGTEQLSQEGN